ncbi:MAG: hypothetical protein KY463_09465 [Actinobacteria bacterium]|nr:hypothetical protein [Actinomycetota bacterium]
MTTAMEPDDLYGLPLDQFIPERGALVKSLRAGKRRDEAAAVAALRKPSLAAWAVNQVVRSQGASVQELFAAGDELRDAQARLLAGTGDGRALRAANERERAAVDELVRAAQGLLSSDGHELSPTVVERVAATLHAAALDEDARAQMREGRLEHELRHVGLGLGESADPFAAAPPAQPQKKAPPAAKPGAKAEAPAPATSGAADADATSRDERRAAREQATRERQERERGVRDRAEARKAARTAEAAAKRRAERARHALKAAQERRERAAKALEQADEALAAAHAEAQDALAAHEQAQAELDAV